MHLLFLKRTLSGILGAIVSLVILLSCSPKENKTKESTLQFEEINFDLKQINKKEGTLEYKISYLEENLYLDIDLETESCILKIKDKSIHTDFNFTYDTDLESSLEEIKVLKSNTNKNIIIILPVTTEEFLSFQLIMFDYTDKTFINGEFIINTHDYKNVRNYYLDNKVTLTQSNNSFEISLNDFRYNGAFIEIKHP